MARANTDIAITQQGKLLLGGRTSQNPIEVDYQQLSAAVQTGQDYVGWWDDFLGDTLNGTYAPDLSTGATAAVSAAANGKVRLATSTTDENHATLALGLHWTVSAGPTFVEVKVTNVSAATSRSVEVGFSDALSETAGEAFSSHDASIVAVADDAAVFAFNTEETVTVWKALSVKAAGTPQGTVSTVSPVAATWDVLRVELDAAGTAYFSINGSLVAVHTNAIATTALLTPWITATTQTTGDRQIDVDYLWVSGGRA